MKRLLLCLSIVPLCLPGASQSLNSSQQVVLAGLRAASGQGSFRAAAYAVDGSLILLYDQGDGIRVLKTDASCSTILAQSLTGSTGDSGVAMALDTVGNIYVAGTTTSNALRATSGAAFPSRADTTTNSFIAKYDTNLNLVFLTFLGSGRTIATSVAATADAVFVTGVTFNTQFPVTPPGIQQAPALNSTENGFVERFNVNGSTLVYATYLTGANGTTTPTVIAADTSDNAYITGSTSAAGYPTIKAIQPVILGSTSGFLSSLTPAGDGFVYSTFLAGTGMTGMALDERSNSLVLTGGISLGQFPIATVSMPIASTSYQTLLRIPLDGQSVTSSVLLVPGSQTHVSTGANGDVWVTGSLTTPLFPGTVPPDYSAGDSFLMHLTSSSTFDQTLRFGGTPTKNLSYATLVSSVAAPAVNAAEIAVPGTLQTGISASLLSTQKFDLPLVKSPNSGPLPNVIHDALPAAAACTSQCTGSAGLVTIVRTSESAPSLSLSTDDLPNVILRNMGSATAVGLSITANGFNIATDCGATLAPSGQCSLALSGSGPGSIVVSSSNAPTATAMLGLSPSTPDPIALSTAELDFGVTTADSPTARTVTVSNLTSVTQTVVSQLAAGPSSASAFSESASDCPDGGASGQHRIAPNSSCHITLLLRVSPSSANDGPVRATWMIGTRVLVVTGFAQAAALSVSATQIDFGTHFSGNSTPVGANLPRYLYISNNGATPVSHTAVSLSPGSPFSVEDTCPSVLDSHSVCQMKLNYSPVNSPSQDSVSLSLDNGISVLLTGTTLPPPTITGSSANPSLSVSTTNLTFATPVIVTGVSSATQSVLLKNTGASPFALSITSSGDFQLTNGCPSQLLGGASCIVLVGFAPSQPGMRLGLLSLVAGNGFAPTYISLSGTALAVLPASNGTLDFGETYIGEPEVLWLKVQQQIASLTASSSSSAFGLALVQDMGGGHGTLPASDFTPTVTGTCVNCWLGVQFLPRTAAFQAGTLSLSSTPSGNPYLATLTGTASPADGLVLTPVTQDFGTVSVNSSSAPMTFSLANLSTIAATIQSVTSSGDFFVTTNSTGGASCLGALSTAATCLVQVIFSPTAMGERNGSLEIVTSVGTIQATFTGYGVPDPGVAISPNELDYENTPGPSSTQQSVLVSNTGTSVLTIGSVTASAPNFSVASGCTVLSPGSVCSISVVFAPQMATVTGTLSIPITVTINGQTQTTVYTVALNGGYTAVNGGLQIVPSEVDFGATAAGATGGTRQFTINNISGKQLNVTLQMPRQFPLTAAPSCITLAPGGSCTFSVTFMPITDGPITGSVNAQGLSTDGLTRVQTIGYMTGYAAGIGVLDVDGLPIPYSPVSFGQVGSGQSTSHTLTLTNGGSGTLTIHRISSASPFLTTNTCVTPLASGASCSVTITYAPTYQLANGSSSSAARSDSDSLLIESDAASSPDVISLSGLVLPMLNSNPVNPLTLATFDLTQSALTFADTPVGSVSVPQSINVTNTGTTTLHIGSVVASPDFVSNTTCGTVLVGASCTISVALAPANVASSSIRSGTLHILSDAGTSLEFISLLGVSSAGPLSLSPNSLDFGPVNVGSTATLSLTLRNSTATPITFLGYAAGGDYTLTNGTCPNIGNSLPAGSSCSLNVSFTPTATGARSSTLSLTTDATTLPLSVALRGTGIQPITPSPSFVLTVNGGNAATLTVASGSPAVYNLSLTPINGFTGPVALTCTPVAAATYASCSLLSSTLTVSGSSLAATATINTITTAAIRIGVGASLLLFGPMLLWRRRRRWIAATLVSGMTVLLALGCGSSAHGPATSNIQRSPPGSYQYQVTASSTTGTAVSSTVTLNLIVQ